MTVIINGSSGITDVDGTASAPALTGTDTDTGIFFPAANTIAFSTAGTEDMRIDSAGNVGIGTSSPAASLSVAKQTTALSGTSNSYGLYMYPTSSGLTYIDAITNGAGNTSLGFRTYNNGTYNEMRMDYSGNLLVGGTAARGTTVGTKHLDLFDGTAPAGTLTNGISLYSSSGDLNFMTASGNGFKVGFRNLPPVGTKTGSYTLATGDVGKYVQVGSGGSITIPDATFAEGDAVSIFNNTTGNITITCSITTAYIAGTDSDKATMTLATRGVATVLFISGTVCVVTGNVT